MKRVDGEFKVSRENGRIYVQALSSYDYEEAVDALTARLKADGYEVTSGPRTTGDGYYESCIAAVEGNLIELTV